MEISLLANRLLNRLNVKLPGHFYSHQCTDFLRHAINLLFRSFANSACPFRDPYPVRFVVFLVNESTL